MLDKAIRHKIDPALDKIGKLLAKKGMGANQITLAGFALIPFILYLLSQEYYGFALGLILLNRLLDGLDGAVARVSKPTDLGGFLDISCDFLFYACVPLGFALANPLENGVAAAFLLFAFIGSGTSFLAFAIIAEKRGNREGLPETPNPNQLKSFYYLGGLTEGSETIFFFVLICLFPHYFVILAVIFAILCLLTSFSRLYQGYISFRDK